MADEATDNLDNQAGTEEVEQSPETVAAAEELSGEAAPSEQVENAAEEPQAVQEAPDGENPADVTEPVPEESQENQPSVEAAAEDAPEDAAEDGAANEGDQPAKEGEEVPQEDVKGEDGENAEQATAEQVEGEAGPTEEGESAPKDDHGTEEQMAAAADESAVAPEDGQGEFGDAEGTEGVEGAEEGTKPEANAEETNMEGVPQSDTFADGEKPESPAPHVGEVLSREGSPQEKQIEEEGKAFTPPVAESPRDEQAEEAFETHELEEEIMSPEQDREALIEIYHQAVAEREQLQQQNHQLQHKLAEYFKKKKTDEQKPEAVDKNEADQEQRYLKYMSQLEELRLEDQQIRETYSQEIEELQMRCDEKQQEVDTHKAKFVEFKHQVALNALNSRSGKPIPPADIEQYLAAENRKDQEVIGVRLENIKLKNKLKKKEQQLKSKEELADGLHLIDFEQLKIENQTYNEKIEERNEELLKLRKKITNTVQVLTHLKEKLQFVQGENTLLKTKLKDVEASVAQKRDVLTRTKQARDALRIDNHRLRQNCGLLGNEPLLRDFEERKDEADSLRERLERLKMQHAELTLNTASVRRKIEQIKAVEQR